MIKKYLKSTTNKLFLRLFGVTVFNKPKLPIRADRNFHTVYPDEELEFNNWNQVIHNRK